jgi:hypothetical protein
MHGLALWPESRKPLEERLSGGSGGGIRTRDLGVMGPIPALRVFAAGIEVPAMSRAFRGLDERPFAAFSGALLTRC